MNIGLYREILGKLNRLSVDETKPENIRGLMGVWSNRASQRDVVSVLCAFYGYMDGNIKYNFIHSVPDWQNFFKGHFSNYFKIDKIKADFDDIIFAERITDIILEFADKNTIKEFYEYAKLQNDFYMKNNNPKYKEDFAILERKCVSMGLAEKTVEWKMPEETRISETTDINVVVSAIKSSNPNAKISIDNTGVIPKLYSSIPIGKLVLPNGFYVNEKNGITNKHNTKSGMYCSIDVVDLTLADETKENKSISTSEVQVATAKELDDKQREIEKQMATLRSEYNSVLNQREEKRENIFSAAASSVGVDQEKLIKKVGNSESYNVDSIVVDPRLINMVKGEESKVASLPKAMYGNLKNRVSSRRKLKMMELDLVTINGMSTLTLSKKDTIFDKIANTSREVLYNIKKSAQDKALTIAAIGYIGKETVKSAIINTNEKIKTKAKDISNQAQGVLYNAVVGLGTAQMNAQDFIDDKKERIVEVKDNLAMKSAEKLRNFADRIEPSQDIVNETKSKIEFGIEHKVDSVEPIKNTPPKETQTYINTSRGRAKVVLRAATKAGEMPVKEEMHRSL